MKPMDNGAWDRQRERAILAEIQTGRPVLADSDGAMHYADGGREPVADDVGGREPVATEIVKRSWWARLRRRWIYS